MTPQAMLLPYGSPLSSKLHLILQVPYLRRHLNLPLRQTAGPSRVVTNTG